MSPLPSGVQIGMLRPRARWRAIGDQKAAGVVVEFLRQIARLGVWRKIEHPQVRLRVGIDWLGRRRDKSDLFPVRTKGECTRVRAELCVEIDRGDFGRLAALGRDEE